MIYHQDKTPPLHILLILWCGTAILYGIYTAATLGLYLWLSRTFDCGFWTSVLILGILRGFFALPDCIKRYNLQS